MEGIPRVPMIAPEMKVPSQPFPDQFRTQIKSHIASHYQDDPDKYDSSLDELEQMRSVVFRCQADVESLCVAKRYYSQLLMMKKRFPMEENDVLAISFAWTDRMLDLMNQLCYEDINFEMCCVLFNIGAAHAQIAAGETRTEMDSIKNAFMHFQFAAWPIQQLRDQLGAARFSTCDFESPYLTFYLNVLLAQSQECMLEKSMIDHRKPLVVARVALHLYNVYKQCAEHLDNSGLAELLSSGKYKELERLCYVKGHLYGAISNYYLGEQAHVEEQYGTRLAYFERSLAQVKAAMQVCEREMKPRSPLREAVNFVCDVITQRESNARKENDIVYHERIPKLDELTKLEGVCMVKPIGFDPCDQSVGGEDLFRALLPTDVVKAISLYSEEKNAFKRKLLDKVVQKDSELENYLLSLKLDQLALDQPADQVRLPDELLAASAAFNAQPDALPDLLDNFQKVTTSAQQSDAKLGNLRHRLKEITNPLFVRDEGYKAIGQKLDELGDHHAKARENNAELQRAMATHSENLKLLSQPLPELSKQICGNFTNPGDCQEGQQLRRVTEKVDEMRRQRCKLVEQFRADLESDDITKKALAERELDPRALFAAELHKHDSHHELIEQNLRAQENILRALTDANANFAEIRRQIIEANEKRALYALTLVTAYQVFIDIVDKTARAAEFYAQLKKLLGALEKGIINIEAANAEFASEEERKRAVEEERRRRETEVREARQRQEEAAHEAARAVNEFRFG